MKNATHPIGPGWFDSSLDLRSGLDVVEAEPADLDLPSWIEVFIAGMDVQPRAARVASPRAMTAIA